MTLLSLQASVISVNHLRHHLQFGVSDTGRVIGRKLVEVLGYQGAFAAVVSALKYASAESKSGASFMDAINDEEICKSAEMYFFPAFIRACKLGTITFYTDKMHWADNFSAFAIEVDEVVYPTVEHAYQAAKFDDEDLKERIISARSPYLAKGLGKDPKFASKKRPAWEEEKVAIMLKLLQAKVSQHAYVKNELLSTGISLLVEDSPTDDFWGRGPAWNGLNMLGRLWFLIRECVRADREVSVEGLNEIVHNYRKRKVVE
jgi:ribA/ribD-fused uncharacterized protein